MIERYTRPEMGRIWTLENKFQKWLEVEVLAAEAMAELGIVPREAAAALRQGIFTVDAQFVARVAAIESETHHDVVAFTTAVAERMGEPAKWVHYGLTSSDVVDTAQAVILKEAAERIEQDLAELSAVLCRRAVEFKDTLMIGRTHGVHAEPTTFGLKLALWWQEVERNRARMARARAVVAVGKLSGAVGTYANIDPFVERYVCERLGLSPAPVATQVLQRDRHAELLTSLAIIGGTLEKMAVEIRHLQRTEVREAEEPFRSGQKGSSAMPHKRNPVGCENITGLSRVLRAGALVGLENMALWHERDISHSSAERVALADSTIVADYALHRMRGIIAGLRVYPENMLRNLSATGGLVASGRVLLALVEKGLSREQAYAIVQSNAMAAWEEGPDSQPFQERVAADPAVAAHLSPNELAACFDYRDSVRRVDEIFARLGLK